MKTAMASAMKNQFGQFPEMALTQPVAISKTGRRVAVKPTWKEYERLAALEDAWWANQAAEAEKKGYLGAKASAEFLRSKAVRQIVAKRFPLMEGSEPPDSQALSDSPFRRADIGEYRVLSGRVRYSEGAVGRLTAN